MVPISWDTGQKIPNRNDRKIPVWLVSNVLMAQDPVYAVKCTEASTSR